MAAPTTRPLLLRGRPPPGGGAYLERDRPCQGRPCAGSCGPGQRIGAGVQAPDRSVQHVRLRREADQNGPLRSGRGHQHEAGGLVIEWLVEMESEGDAGPVHDLVGPRLRRHQVHRRRRGRTRRYRRQYQGERSSGHAAYEGCADRPVIGCRPKHHLSRPSRSLSLRHRSTRHYTRRRDPDSPSGRGMLFVDHQGIIKHRAKKRLIGLNSASCDFHPSRSVRSSRE